MTVGMQICRPSTVVVAGAGSSASIRTNGGVEFFNATSLSLNNVFSSLYDNYMSFIGFVGSADLFLNFRLRLNGVDESAANYVYQDFNTDNTTVSTARSTAQTGGVFASTSTTNRSLSTVYIYGPALAQSTAFRRTGVSSQNGGRTGETVNTHSLSVAYDGFTIFPNTGTMTGVVTVYGYAQ